MLQDSVDEARDRFANLVSIGRGLKVSKVINLEGDWFEGAEAVSLGLMDAVTTERAAWALLEDEVDKIKRERRQAA
jgi:ClpP class serine protease